MASSKEYAQWLVDNADQEGTEDFDTVGKAFLKAKEGEQGESAYQKYTPNIVKNVVGVVESGARMLPNAVSGMLANTAAAGAGILTGKGPYQTPPINLEIPALTKQGAEMDKLISDTLEHVKGVVSDASVANQTYDPNAPAGAVRANPKDEAANRFMAEAPFDILMGAAGLKGGVLTGRSMRDLFQEKYGKDPNAASKKLIEADLKAREGDLTKYQIDLDNNMVRYPQNYEVGQAPQLGVGNKRPSQAAFDADMAGIAKNQPDPGVVPFASAFDTTNIGGIEQTLRGGGQATLTNPREVRTPTSPLESMLVDTHQPTSELLSTRGGTPIQNTARILPDPLDMHMDPVTRITAIDELSKPHVAKAVEEVRRSTEEAGRLRDSFNLPENVAAMDAAAKIEGEITKLRARLDSPEIKDNTVAENQIKNIIKQAETGLTKLGPELNRIDTAAKMLRYAEERMGKAQKGVVDVARAAAETAAKNTLKIERTFDGRQKVTLPPRMKGEIDLRLIANDVSHLIKTIGESAVVKAFIGTYRSSALSHAVINHFNQSGGSKLGWISPDEFHSLANKRSPSFLSGKSEGSDVPAPWSSPPKRESIRRGIRNAGLDDIPMLVLDNPHFEPSTGALMLDVMGHEGRHRMDVFKEIGLDTVPINWMFNKEVRDAVKNAQDNKTPIKLIAEDGSAVADFRGFAKLDAYDFGRRAGPRKQMGAADNELITNIATLGVAGLLKKGINALKNTPTEKPTPKIPKSDQASVLASAVGEARTLGEVKKTLTKEQMETDIPDGLATAAVSNLTNGSFLAHFTDHPLVRYATDKVSNIIRMNNLQATMSKDGGIFGLKGITSHTIDPKSPKALWGSLSRAEKELLSTIGNNYGGLYELSRTELKGLGASEKVADAYRAFVDSYSKAVDDVNSVRTKDPINKLPGYFPKFRDGDFKLQVKDSNGDVIWSDLFKTRAGRYFMERQLKERFPDHEVLPSEVDRGTRGNPYNVSTVPFEDLIQAIGRGDPRVKAMESVVREIKGKRGYGRHAIQRRNIEGGDLDPTNFYKAFESYVDSAYRYKSNLEMKDFNTELNFDPDIKAPRLKRWVNDYTQLASGSFDPGWIANAVYGLAKVSTDVLSLGQAGSTAPTTVLRAMNNLFMMKALFSWRPPFLVAQIIQPDSYAPQWMAHHQAQGHKGSIIASYLSSDWEMLKAATGHSTPEFRTFISDYMVPRGNIDASMIHAMDLFGQGQGKTHSALRWIAGMAPATAIEAVGRLRTAAMGYSFFKQSGLTGRELYQQVERFTNDVMVDYGKQEQPSWVGKTGIVGQAAGPLSTFASNFAGSTALFMRDIAKNPNNITAWKPLSIHIAQTAFWAGATGMLGTKVVDSLINILKFVRALPPDHPTLTDWFMTSKQIPDMAAFGVASGLSDKNLGASMAAPEVHAPGANTIPGIKMMEDLVTNLWPILSPFQKSTEAQRQQAIRTMMPNYLNSFMDLYEVDVSPPGRPWYHIDARKREMGEVIPNPAKRGQGSVRLTPDIESARQMGTKTISEIRTQAGIRAADEQKILEDKQKTTVVDLAVDQIMTGKGDKTVGELAQEAVKLGMTPKDFLGNVQSTMKSRMTEKENKVTGMPPKTPSQQQRYQLIQDFKR